MTWLPSSWLFLAVPAVTPRSLTAALFSTSGSRLNASLAVPIARYTYRHAVQIKIIRLKFPNFLEQ